MKIMTMKIINKKCSLLTILMVIFIIFSTVNNVNASGGEEMEGSELEKYLLQNGIGETKGLFDDFEEMDYALFLETNVGYGVTGNYYKYGIYGDFVRTVREGENIYFNLCEKVTGTKLSMETHGEWVDNREWHIQNLSPDLQWIIARQYQEYYFRYTDKVISRGNVIAEAESTLSEVSTYFRIKKTEQRGYGLINSELFEKRENIMDEMGGYTYIWYLEDATCTDECGRLLAISEPDSQGIKIYNTEDWGLERRIIVDNIDSDYPLAISQFVGTEGSGWLVFANGSKTYRLNYPEGTLEQLGEFMFDTTFSPDGKYLAYCTGNIELYDKWMSWADDDEKLNKINSLYEEWNKIPAGWYIKEIETGNTTFIPIETWEQDHRPLYGGRCVWIEKDKLLQLLNQ